MLQIFVNAKYDFISKRRWAYLISLVVTLAGLGHIAWQGGLRYGIDFSGGTLAQMRFERPTTVDAVRAALDRVRLGDSIIQQFGDPQEYLIRTPAASGALEETSKKIEQGLREAKLPGFEVRRLEFVGPQVGRDLQLQAVYAVLAGMAGILIYTALRFDFRGGVAAIIALIHDVLVALTGLSLTNREMSLPVLAALLTIVGYSINDTIVVFDRIRENFRIVRKATPIETINISLNQTLDRTIGTSFMTLLAVLALLFVGGEVVRGFSIALLIGILVGTYSSVYVAANVVVQLGIKREDLLLPEKEREAAP
jgi:preprotein translocase subunit SecF